MNDKQVNLHKLNDKNFSVGVNNTFKYLESFRKICTFK